MGFDAPSVEVMTWKLPLGLTALTRSLEQLNVLELVRELKKKNTGMIVDITAISESMCVNLPKIRRILCRVLCSQYIGCHNFWKKQGNQAMLRHIVTSFIVLIILLNIGCFNNSDKAPQLHLRLLERLISIHSHPTTRIF